MSDALNEYLLGSDLIVAIGEVDAVGAVDEYLGASPFYTDRATVLAVQKAIAALPAYPHPISGEGDRLLDLGPDGVDGKWGPNTARAVERFNSEYAGLVAEQAGPRITDGTLQALGIAKPGKAAAKPSAKASAPSSSSSVATPGASPIPGVIPGAQAPAPSGNLALKIVAGVLGAAGVGLVIAGIAGWSRSRAVPR